MLLALPAFADSRVAGVETVHRDSGTAVTIYLPMPEAGGQIEDLNGFQFGEELPTKFVISDGTISSAFISVDDSPGSALNTAVNQLTTEVRSLARNTDSIEVLRTFISSKLADAPEDWHPGISGPQLPQPPEFASAANMPVGAYPLATNILQPTMPVEDFLSYGQGNCVPRTILTTLIMKRLGLSRRLRAGATQTSGHMWLELPDGRHLDPTWQIVGPTSTAGAWAGWFHFSMSYLYTDDVWPFAVDNGS